LVHNKKESTAPISRVLYRASTASVIYLVHGSPHGSSVLPSAVWAPAVLHCCSGLRQLGRATLCRSVYMNLQPPADTARWSPIGWWSLTPPSHPYPACTRRLFSSALTYCHQ